MDAIENNANMAEITNNENMSDFIMNQDIFTIISAIPEEQLNLILDMVNQRFSEMPNSMIEQSAIVSVQKGKIKNDQKQQFKK
jgi:ATP-binding cassette subfamily B protein